MSKTLLDSAIVIATVGTVVYLIAYTFEIGYGSFFNVPVSLIRISHIHAGRFVISVFFVIASEFGMILALRLIDTNIPKTVVAYILISSYSGLIAFTSTIVKAEHLALQFLCNLLVFCLIFVACVILSRTIADKAHCEQLIRKSQIIPVSWVGAVYYIYVCTILFFALQLGVYSTGRFHAYTKDNWHIVSQTNHIVVKVCDDNLICVPIDPNDNRFYDEIVIYKNSEERPLHLIYRRIGHVRPKSRITSKGWIGG